MAWGILVSQSGIEHRLPTVKVCVYVQSYLTLCNLMECRLTGYIGFSKYQEYWSVFPFSPPGDLCDPGIKPVSPALADRFFTTEPASLTYSEKH